MIRRGTGAARMGLLIVAASCGARRDAIPWQTSFRYSADALHAFEVRNFGFPYVPVGFGRDTLWLPFDTGNMVGLTIETEVFARLGLPCSETHNRRDSAGHLVSTSCTAHGVSTNVFGKESDSTSVFEFSHEALPGLVGPDQIPGTRFTMDYGRGVLAIDDQSSPTSVAGFEAVRLVQSPRRPRLVLVHGRVDGREVIVEIDTGKSRTTIDRALVDALQLEETAAGVRIDRVELGPRSWSVEAARVVDTSGTSAGLPARISLGIGSDVLAGFVFTVDYASGYMWVEKPQ